MAATTHRHPPPNTQIIQWVKIVYMNGEKEELGFEYFALSEERRCFHGHNHYDMDAGKLRPTTAYFPFENVRSATTQETRVVINDE